MGSTKFSKKEYGNVKGGSSRSYSPGCRPGQASASGKSSKKAGGSLKSPKGFTVPNDSGKGR